MSNAASGYAGDLSVEEALRILSDGSEATLVDVRTEPEVQFVGAPDLSGLEKDVVFLPWQVYPAMQILPDFSARLTEILRARGVGVDAPVLFLCRSGARSRSAAVEMTKAGWSRCYNVSDGFEGPLDAGRRRGQTGGWKAKGLPWRQS
jgi:rhodanese-related sulfurtransferase